MNKYLLTFFLFVVMMHLNVAAQTTKGKKIEPKAVNLKSGVFSGVWKGNEKCNTVSAPVAFLTVITNGPKGVLISGIYSLQGRAKGSVSGNTINVPLQTVADPNFTNIAIEGVLTLSADEHTLVGTFKVLNNSTTDQCTVVYTKGVVK